MGQQIPRTGNSRTPLQLFVGVGAAVEAPPPRCLSANHRLSPLLPVGCASVHRPPQRAGEATGEGRGMQRAEPEAGEGAGGESWWL